MTDIGVFGSVFDPPTLGHLDVLEQAAGHFDHIILVPSAAHAFSKQPLPFEQRLDLLRCFAKPISLPGCTLDVSEIENALLNQHPNKPVYTFDVLVVLESMHPDANLSFIRGPDNAVPETWRRFYRHAEIEARWPLFTADERVTARSSQVRQLLQETALDDNNGLHELDTLVTPEVRDRILAQGLYRTSRQ
ncbi:adenylyltransferase/cytidyltransferase family protein [Kistimonas asteriae]|uniref:adenylyltransferase/cytidyltransferase family protein n=1 Tax=Kistimonas asteriae TaxID=517724 RepID=UPI001BA58195|nr:adenylyltransferase/cytidyltransferase family protein [Kistimonas asteriae]